MSSATLSPRLNGTSLPLSRSFLPGRRTPVERLAVVLPNFVQLLCLRSSLVFGQDHYDKSTYLPAADSDCTDCAELVVPNFGEPDGSVTDVFP